MITVTTGASVYEIDPENMLVTRRPGKGPGAGTTHDVSDLPGDEMPMYLQYLPEPVVGERMTVHCCGGLILHSTHVVSVEHS